MCVTSKQAISLAAFDWTFSEAETGKYTLL